MPAAQACVIRARSRLLYSEVGARHGALCIGALIGRSDEMSAIGAKPIWASAPHMPDFGDKADRSAICLHRSAVGELKLV